jgi:HK97 family phage major capsid protein
MTLQELRERLEQAIARMNEAADAVEALEDDAPDEERTAAVEAFEQAERDVESARAAYERRKKVDEARATLPAPAEPAADEPDQRTPVTVGREAPTYRPDGDASFFSDLYMASKGDPGALERIARHQRETRDVTTGDPGAAGVVPPVYLAELLAPLPRAGRPFADSIRKLPLPEAGMNLTIPRVQSGVTVAVQATEGTAVSETDIDTETITVPVRTLAGQNDVSIQAFERTVPGIDQIIFQDLRDAYDEQVDTQLLAGSGSSGQHLGIRAVSGINTVTYTDTTPTAAELVPKLYDGLQKIWSTLKRGKADSVALHPRRSAWLASNLSSTFPLFQLGGFMQALGAQDRGFVSGPLGLREVTDANIGTTYGAGTNEDEIYLYDSTRLIFMEGELRARVLAEVLSGTLQVRLQLYAFSAFASAREPKAICVISGTGLVTPTF